MYIGRLLVCGFQPVIYMNLSVCCYRLIFQVSPHLFNTVKQNISNIFWLCCALSEINVFTLNVGTLLLDGLLRSI